MTVGLIAGGGGAVRLPIHIPAKAAMRLLLTGQPINADEALRLGLVNEVVEPDQVRNAAYAIARQVCAAAPLAVAGTMRVTRAGASGVGDETAWRLSDDTLTWLFDTADAAEGQRAFLEKRRPTWTGR